jgi:hypothetical protein
LRRRVGAPRSRYRSHHDAEPVSDHVQCRIRSSPFIRRIRLKGSIKIAKLGELAKADRQPAWR